MTSLATSQRTGWGIALLVSAACCYFLFAWLPYSFGYGSFAIPLTTMLWALWHGYSDWQHCMLVPLIVAALIYWRREKLSQIPIKGSNWALLPLFAGLLLFWAGFRADVQYVGFISIQLILASFTIWFLGLRFFLALLFPWTFLIFAWPFLFLDNIIAFPLRQVMSTISAIFLNLIGLDAVKVGSAVVSMADPEAGLAQGERFAVDIADPCSGINSLFALTMITCVYGYIMLTAVWKKWVLVLLAIPLAIVGNFFRILMLTFGTLVFGADFAIGTIDKPTTYHMLAGFAVFGVALFGMVALCGLLQRMGRRPGPAAV